MHTTVRFSWVWKPASSRCVPCKGPAIVGGKPVHDFPCGNVTLAPRSWTRHIPTTSFTHPSTELFRDNESEATWRLQVSGRSTTMRSAGIIHTPSTYRLHQILSFLPSLEIHATVLDKFMASLLSLLVADRVRLWLFHDILPLTLAAIQGANGRGASIDVRNNESQPGHCLGAPGILSPHSPHQTLPLFIG